MNTDPSVGTKRANILLIQAVDYDSQTLTGFQPLCTPLSIATIAALTSDEFNVDLWDENLDGLIRESTALPRDHYAIVGISTLFEQVGHRVPALSALFRARGTYVCAGGPGISNQLIMISGCVDSVFLNEAEYTWPQFLNDWIAGHPRKEYVQIAKPDLAHSPPPKWDAMKSRISEYRAGGVQTTRGCPFDCEFCNVIYLYGRAQRHKPVEHVLDEVRNLQHLGARRIFFTDDEFVGNPRYAIALLERFIELNNSFPSPLACHTQLTLNLSRNERLLELTADANFWHALIGIESFDEGALEESNKRQNCNRDIIADCRKILSYGIGINGSLIVGFDHDGPEVFDRILGGVSQASIPFASVSILRATHGTKLWARMREQKRLWKLRAHDTLPQALQMDILPGGTLSRAQLIEGRIYVNRELSRVSKLCERLHSWITLVKRLPQVVDPRQLTLDAASRIIRDHRALSLTAGELPQLEEVLAHAQDVAPVMMGRLIDSLLAQLYWYRIRTFHTDEDLKRALQLEREGDLIPDSTPILLPTAFASAFRKRLFRIVYERLFRSLEDSAAVPEAASEVFVDYLVRMNTDGIPAGDGAFCGPKDEEFLCSLCDRVAARVAGEADKVVVTTDDIELPTMTSLKRKGMYDAVLKDVGDRLARLNA